MTTAAGLVDNAAADRDAVAVALLDSGDAQHRAAHGLDHAGEGLRPCASPV